MRDENKEFFKQNTFIDRVQKAMARRDMDYDQLCKLLNEHNYSISKGNLRLYVAQRPPNINFLIVLSRALGVSADYLLGESDDELPEGINHRIYGKIYQKYQGKYWLYYYGTMNNEMKDIEEPAKIEINFSNRNPVKMWIRTPEGDIKAYFGTLQISEISPNAFIILKSSFGELVFMTFYDEAMNLQDFKCAVGGMLSISSGDLKRAPVMNRFIITRYKVSKDKMKFVHAHLKLNTKYINITEDMLVKSVREVLAGSDSDKAEQIIMRLKNAFYEKKYYAIEESFITNTIRKDSGLSIPQADELVAVMRQHSLSNINSKVNKSLDSVVFRNTFTQKEENTERKNGENISE